MSLILSFFALIPPYLIVLIFLLVILPSFAACFLRFFLYLHLTYLHLKVKKLIREQKSSYELELNLEEEPEIIKRLIKRFNKASSVLEQVNTPALIEQIYSQEKIGKLFCEQIDYFCRMLPNLLLAFGLFFTFVGITINLFSLTQTLSQPNISDFNIVVHKLQQPIQGMSIAFVASLVGLFFSAGLTVFNFKFNTVLAKFQLLSSLEDYLDNIYQPTIEGYSRLDKAVERMVFNFNEFLSRFGETVREAVESPLRDSIQKIEYANTKAASLATDMYTQLLNTSVTLERGATIFQESAEVIKRTEFPENLSTITEGLANAQKDFSQSSLILNDSMKFTESATKLLHNSVTEIVHLSEKTAQVLEITKSSQQSLREIIPQLHQGAEMFQPAVKTLDELQKRTAFREDSLGDIQIELVKLVENLKNHTNQVSLEIQALCNKLLESLTEKLGDKRLEPTTTAPNGLEPQYIKALEAYMRGEYKEAAIILKILVQKHPKVPKVYLLQGNTYFELKHYKAARNAYEIALNMSNDLALTMQAKNGIAKIKRNLTESTNIN
jgi:tetratricopeptide (TPR) repeat protein